MPQNQVATTVESDVHLPGGATVRIARPVDPWSHYWDRVYR